MKRLLSVTGFTALLTLLRMLSGFVIAKVVAIYTGPTGMAMLGQIQSVIGILNGVINAPAGSGVIRYTAENIESGYDACSPWWRASLQWIIGLLAIFIPLGILLSKPLSLWLFENQKYYWIIILACFALPFVAANTLITSVINGQQKYKRYVALGMISNVISTICMLTLIYYANIQGALIAAAINTAISGCVMVIASLYQPWFKLKYWWGRVESEQRKRIGSYVLMALTSALTAPVSMIFIRNILVAEVGWNSTGQWQAIWKISEVYLSVVIMSLSTYYLPKLSSLINYVEIKNEIRKTACVVMPIVIAMTIVVYFCRDIIVSLLFTSEFHQVRNLFAIQLLGDIVKIFSWLYAYPMISRGATKWFVSTEIFFSLLFVFLAFFFVEKYGLQGATIAYLVNYLVYFGFVLLFLEKIIKDGK